MSERREPTAAVLVVNAGSTSTKLAIVGATDEVTWARTVEPDDAALDAALTDAAAALRDVTAVGHRVVHGGARFVEPVVVDAQVVDEIDALAELAPLHNAAGVAGIRAARARLPDVPHVACFDTAFHATLPTAARAYGGPQAWLDAGLRKYGFHGLSHEYAAARTAELLGRPPDDLRLVTCHLGGGCSLTAVDRGRSIDTTMGFTPLDGLVMATRSGSVDPGLLLHLLRRGMPVDELDELLERRSGLLGLSGSSGDLREVLEARDRGDERAGLAIDVFVHRLLSGIGAMAAALSGLDAIVFTGGIGERAAEIRRRAVGAFEWVGAAIDEPTNRATTGDADVSAAGAAVKVVVVTAREDLVIARSTRALVGSR